MPRNTFLFCSSGNTTGNFRTTESFTNRELQAAQLLLRMAYVKSYGAAQLLLRWLSHGNSITSRFAHTPYHSICFVPDKTTRTDVHNILGISSVV